jgi:hypothetical protein
VHSIVRTATVFNGLMIYPVAKQGHASAETNTMRHCPHDGGNSNYIISLQ